MFENLNPELKRLINKRFKSPTPIQREIIPKVLEGKDLLVISEMGSGKTEAAMLPILHKVIESNPPPISVLYITPLRSLNRDLLSRLTWWVLNLDLNLAVRHSDTTPYERSMQSQNPPDLLICTPETLLAMLTGKNLRSSLANIQCIVIDEVHEVAGNKRGAALSLGVARLRQLLKKPPQIIGLSATVGNPKEIASWLSSGCEVVNTTKTRDIEINVEWPPPKKGEKLMEGLRPATSARLFFIKKQTQDQQALIFTNTRELAELVSTRLRYLETPNIDTHHSSLSKDVRIKTEKAFKDNELKALVCTSSLELGIDIGTVNLTIQYGSPRQVGKLLQRVGRSGHSLDLLPKGIVLPTNPDECFEAAAISKLALEGKTEDIEIIPPALDVLAHGIVGLAMEYYNIPTKKAFDILTSSPAYRGFGYDDFMSLCNFLRDVGYITISEDKIKRRKAAFQFYFDNLSTIPNTRTYKIIDSISNMPVGTLDEDFVSLHCNPGVSIICKGMAWRIIDIQPMKVIVEPLDTLEGAIPAWQGELIPVPYQVSQQVGILRQEIADSKDLKGYPISKRIESRLARLMTAQRKAILPTNNRIVIEYDQWEGRQIIVIHNCGGSKVNETLGHILCYSLTQHVSSVGLQTDPYRIIIQLPRPLNPELIKETLLKPITKKSMKDVVRARLSETDLFYYKFFQVGQRFGIINKEADVGKPYIKKIAQIYSKGPVNEETFNELLHQKLDIERAHMMLEQIINGGIEVVLHEGISPLGRIGLQTRYELIANPKPTAEILEQFSKRLLDTRMGLICFNCAKWERIVPVKETPTLVCPFCQSRLIACLPKSLLPRAKKMILKSRSGSVDKSDERFLGSISLSASLVANSPNAVKILAGRGIGPRTAARIMEKSWGATEEELHKQILKAEQLYSKTKRFWRI